MAGATSEEFAQATGLHPKTCRNLLAVLKGRKLLDREGERYVVPMAAVPRAVAELKR